MAVKTRSKLGYFYGLTGSRRGREESTPTGAEKFQSLVESEGAYYAVGSRIPRERQRMAGDVFNLNLTQSPGTPATFPLPKTGSAELRLDYIPRT